MKATSLTFLALTPLLSAATISIQPTSTIVSPSGTFALNITAVDVSDLYAFQFDLGFTPGLLSAISIVDGSLLSSGGSTFFLPGTIDNADGTISFTADALISAVPGVTGSGTLAMVTFQALSAGLSPITISNLLLLDSSLSTITANSVNGSVTVQGSTSAAPEPATCMFFSLAAAAFAVFLTRGLRPYNASTPPAPEAT